MSHKSLIFFSVEAYREHSHKAVRTSLCEIEWDSVQCNSTCWYDPLMTNQSEVIEKPHFGKPKQIKEDPPRRFHVRRFCKLIEGG